MLNLADARSRRQCELCNRTFQDSLSYLDHVNGRFRESPRSPVITGYACAEDLADAGLDLRRMGQTTQVARSTLSQVREKIRQLRESTATKVTAKNYDFSKRLAEVRQVEADEKQRRKEERKRKREERREEEELGKIGIMKRTKVEDVDNEAVGGGLGRSRSKANGHAKPGDEDKVVDQARQEHDEMAAMMGFGGFGGGRKK